MQQTKQKKQTQRRQKQQQKLQQTGTETEVDNMPPTRTSYIKKSRLEEEQVEAPSSGRSWADKVMDKTISLNVPATPKETAEVCKGRSLSSFHSRAPSPFPSTIFLNSISTRLHMSVSSPPHPSLEKKKKNCSQLQNRYAGWAGGITRGDSPAKRMSN